MTRMWLVVFSLVAMEQCIVRAGPYECEDDAPGMLQMKPASQSTTSPPETNATRPSNSTSPKQVPKDSVKPQANITTFQWEPHWQCAQADAACISAAQQKFQQLVAESGAQIAAALELQGAGSLLPNWSSSKEYEDAVSIMVAPGWQVLKEGGGNICCDGQRGLAVMLVKPPWQLQNCEQLCLMAVHPGHSPIQSGQSIVQSVCGSATEQCAIALGDWNVDAAGVSGGSFNSWQRLVGGAPPVFVVPDSETCCHPSTCCRFDHVATNIFGAKASHVQVWDYQLTDQFSMDEEHMPVSVHFTAPLHVALIS